MVKASRLTWACLLLVIATASRADEPAHAGKTLSEWRAALGDPSAYPRRMAAEALGKIGPAARAALPDLSELVIRDEDSAVRGAAAQALQIIGGNGPEGVAALIRAMTAEGSNGRLEAASVLCSIGPPLAPAIPALLAAIPGSDDAVRANFRIALVAIGPEAIPPLIGALRHAKPAVRRIAALALGDLRAKEAVPALEAAPPDDDLGARVGVAWALGRIEPARATRFVPALVQALGGGDPTLRKLAVELLAEMGPEAKAAVAPLARATQDPDTSIRGPAWQALARIGKDAVPGLIAELESADEATARGAAMMLTRNDRTFPGTVPALVATVRARGGTSRPGAAAVLLQIDPEWAGEAIPALVAALKSPREAARLRAAEALGRAGPAARDARPALLAALADRTPAVRYQAALAVARFDPPAPEAVPTLVAALDDPRRRGEALLALGAIGPAARDARPALAALLKGLQKRDSYSHRAVLGAMAKVGPDEASVPALIAALSVNYSEVREDAIRALAQAGPAAAPAIIEAWKSGTGFEPVMAEALGSLGPGVIPRLVAALADPEPKVRRLATSAFAFAGEPAVPALSAALKDGAPQVRRGAAEALGRFAYFQKGSLARGGVPALLAALDDPDGDVRCAAVLACDRIAPDRARDEKAVAAWLELLGRGDLDSRTVAAERLGTIDPPAAQVVPAFVVALGDPAIQGRAAAVLERHGRAAVPGLVGALRGPDAAVRRMAAELLGRIRAAEPRGAADAAQVRPGNEGRSRVAADPAEGVVTALAGALKDPEPAVRLAAVEALQSHDPAIAVPALLGTLQDEDLPTRRRVGEVLNALEPIRDGQPLPSWARPSVPYWIAQLKDPSDPHRLLAATTLKTMGPTAREAVLALADALHDAPVREAAIGALERIGPEVPGVVPALASAASDPGPQVRYAAVHALRNFGAKAPGALPTLTAATGDRDTNVRAEAARGLGAHGVAGVRGLIVALQFETRTRGDAGAATASLVEIGETAVPILVESLDAPDAATRDAAATGLAALAWKANSGRAVSALVVARRHPDESVRERAADILASYDTFASLRAYTFAVLMRPWRVLPWWTFGAALLVGLLAAWPYLRRRGGRDEAEPPSGDLPDAASKETALADRYAKALANGSTRTPFEFLLRHPHATPRECCAVLLVDQEHRWRRGRHRPVEEYFARCPIVATDDGLVLDLLAGHCRWAREYGIPVDLDALVAPFPGLRARLIRRLERRDAPTVSYGGAGPDDDELDPVAGPANAGGTTVTAGPRRDAIPPPTVTLADATRTYAARSLLSDTEPEGVPDRPGLAGRSLIGRYRVEGVLGEGAFGTVYQAQDEELRRSVAIKVPRPERVATEGDIEAYLAEARVVAGLDHPGIVPVYDVGRSADGLCYVVSKLIPDSDLARRLRRARPAPWETAAIVARAAEALHYAHRKGLVHRDVKPANLLLDEQGDVYVADFGLALTRERALAAPGLAGTPAYMSPEQARGGDALLDGRSDIFSLGVVFYELLTGTRPFHGRDLAETLRMVQHLGPVHPIDRDGAVPVELNRICLRCLAKDPAARFGDAGELAAALRRWEKSAAAGDRDPLSLRLVPERGRPFEARDSALYLDLMPGPSGADGLPSHLRAWKAALEGSEPILTLAGPPGAGKSSFVRAGLLPRLSDAVIPVVVEATPDGTEAALSEALRRRFPDLPPGAAPDEACRHAHAATPAGTRVLLVIDQLERWLRAHPDAGPADALPGALRLCDGRRLGALLVTRDRARRFLTRCGLASPAIVEPDGAALAFDVERAYQVLVRIGQAFRRLPDDPVAFTADQRVMLYRVVRDLAEGDSVRPLRLSQFARTVRDLPWTPAAFSQLGGVGGRLGIRVAILEGRLGESDPLHGAARAFLASLLPPEGRAGRPASDPPPPSPGLMAVLDDELRIVTAADPDAPPAAARAASPYRFAEDDLAPAVRLWLKRKPRAGRELPADGFARAAALAQFDRAPGASRHARSRRRAASLGCVLAPLPFLGLAGVLRWTGFAYTWPSYLMMGVAASAASAALVRIGFKLRDTLMD